MNPEKIELENISKMLVYEQQSRVIDKLDREQAINLAKSYFKLYLKQQEVVANLVKSF
jgi:hypothetical protein